MTMTRNGKRLQAHESKAFKRQKFTWLGWVKDFIKAHELPPSAYLYASHTSDKFNEERGGVAWEGCGETAKAIGMNKSSVLRLQHRFVELGLFDVEWGKQGKGHSTRCWMALKGARVHLSKGAKRCAAKGAFEHAKGAPVHMTLSKNLSMKTSKEVFHRGEREGGGGRERERERETNFVRVPLMPQPPLRALRHRRKKR